MKTDLLPSLNWDIRTESVKISSMFDTGKKAIIRTDNNHILSIVGKDYCPVSNAQLMSFTTALTETGEFELKGFDEINDGKTILAFLQNKNPNLKINGCAMKEYMFVGNTHDGTKALTIGTANNLVRCSNQFYSTLKVYRKKHTSPFVFNQIEIQDIIRSYKVKKSQVYGAFDGMESVRVDQGVINRLVVEIHKMLETDNSISKKENLGWSPSMQLLRKSIDKEMKDIGNNAFGLFNGVTWYTSHEMRNAESVSGRISGTANQINQKAYRFCNNLKRASNNMAIL
jgi:hypothetical protein